MAMCSDACASVSGADSSSTEAGYSCLRFGVRSYLHHFYEECSSSVRNGDAEDQGWAPNRRSTLTSSLAVWKVSLGLGLLILTAGVASMSAGYSTALKIESFGENDMFFVDPQAISFNRGRHLTTAAGIGLSCLGSAVAAMGLVIWILPRTNQKDRHSSRDWDQGGRLGFKWMGFKHAGEVVTKAPGVVDGGQIPVSMSKVECVQPSF
ncbi:neurensin 1-like [Neosynchiropus ocellatus]